MQDNIRYMHSELSETILGCCFDVMNELGTGFLESVYKNALFIAIKEKGLTIQAEKKFEVIFRGRKVGYLADLIVEEAIIVELKCCDSLHGEHQAQLINYLKASGILVGMPVNFGNKGEITGIAFIDSTSIDVCHNKRIKRNKVFQGLAKRGKTTSGWFYGFKLHLIINEKGEILAFQLTPGNIADVSVAETLARGIFGKLFGDKGYISAELAKKLLNQGLELFTTLRSNMKQKLMKLTDRILLRKRAIIETVNDQLKNISQIEHTRHRSAENCVQTIPWLMTHNTEILHGFMNIKQC